MDSPTPHNLNTIPGREHSAGARQLRTSDGETAVAAEGPILFFDGVCGLCNRFVDFTLTHDRKARIRMAPLQGETARDRLTPADVQSLDSVVLLDERGLHRRSAAVVRVLRQFSPTWQILAGLLWLIPRPLRDLGYKLVAANRYRLFGKKETCRMPSPGERARFLP
jgi:predicted DCC family thiol-disulfide oxidoreductase YuxK